MSFKQVRNSLATKSLFPVSLCLLTVAVVQAAMPSMALAQALPTGATVTHGQAVIQQAVNQLQINQSTPNAVIEWGSFNVGTGNAVNFQVPTGGATLNQITGTGSQIHGNVSSNGALFMVNPRGVLIGRDANVNVGSLVVTSGSLSADNFMNSNFTVTEGGGGTISNAGNITSASGGYVVLAGPGDLENTGVITAPDGSIQLVSADKFTLTLPTKNRFLSVSVDTPSGGEIENNGTLKGGDINLQALSIRNFGTIQASSVGDLKGAATLSGDFVVVSGTITSDADIKLSSSSNNSKSLHISNGKLSAGRNIQVNAKKSIMVLGNLETQNGDIELTSEARVVFYKSTLTANEGNIQLTGTATGPQLVENSAGVVVETSALKASSKDNAKGQINVTGLAKVEYGGLESGSIFYKSSLTGNSINVSGQGKTGISVMDGNTFTAQDIFFTGSSASFGPWSAGITFDGTNKMNAGHYLGINGYGGSSGVSFDGNTTLSSPHTDVSGSTIDGKGNGIRFGGTLNTQNSNPNATAVFNSNGAHVKPKTI